MGKRAKDRSGEVDWLLAEGLAGAVAVLKRLSDRFDAHRVVTDAELLRLADSINGLANRVEEVAVLAKTARCDVDRLMACLADRGMVEHRNG